MLSTLTRRGPDGEGLKSWDSAVLGHRRLAIFDLSEVGAQPMLYRSDNSGALWSPVGPSGVAQWAYLGFTDSTHGVALGYVGSIAPANERLYYTTDAGQTYHLVPLP